jgi:hypothetical protein
LAEQGDERALSEGVVDVGVEGYTELALVQVQEMGETYREWGTLC